MSYAAGYGAQITTTPAPAEDSSVKAVWIIAQWFVIFVKLAWPAFFVCAYCQVGIFKGTHSRFLSPVPPKKIAQTSSFCNFKIG